MNFAKRCCADDANLCEIVSVAPVQESASQEFIDKLLQKNRFNVRYREQLEKTSATGTVGAYIYLQNAKYLEYPDTKRVKVRGGDIRINYVEADCIIPLTVENSLVTECAFCATNKVKGKDKTTLVIFTQKEGKYKAETIYFDEHGRQIDSESSSIQLGEVKPFSIMTNAEVNNLDNMEGYGLPKIYNVIPMFKALDLCYNVLFSDLSKADKIVLLNEALCSIKSKDGKPELTPEQKEIFILLGEKLPTEKSLIQEYNPEIRVDEITKAFELVLSLISLTFGYGTKKYTFENGQIKTATEYIGARQDAMQELNKQRKNATDYISDIIHAAMWFSNQFQGTNYNTEEELSIEFDDSYVEDKQTKLESMRADAVTFQEIPWLTFMYIKTKYNLSDEEAEKYINEGKMREEPIDDLED
ncbi:MAG: hypothetical protein IJN92_09515 [Lachnospiraceae bacterium]|nr:hypothetical protein [Lachnospiraceae bacterium]